MEPLNLQWLRKNQKTIRAELYGGLADALQAGDTDAPQLGKALCCLQPIQAVHVAWVKTIRYGISYHMTFLASLYTSASSYNAKSPNLIQSVCKRPCAANNAAFT